MNDAELKRIRELATRIRNYADDALNRRLNQNETSLQILGGNIFKLYDFAIEHKLIRGTGEVV